jgi:hypothetical protein
VSEALKLINKNHSVIVNEQSLKKPAYVRGQIPEMVSLGAISKKNE